MAASSSNSNNLLIIIYEIVTHCKRLADVDPTFMGGGHGGTLSVVHVAGHVSGVLAELQVEVWAAASRGQRPTVVQFTAAQVATKHTDRLELNL